MSVTIQYRTSANTVLDTKEEAMIADVLESNMYLSNYQIKDAAKSLHENFFISKKPMKENTQEVCPCRREGDILKLNTDNFVIISTEKKQEEKEKDETI
jgi:hypothetical protein